MKMKESQASVRIFSERRNAVCAGNECEFTQFPETKRVPNRNSIKT